MIYNQYLQYYMYLSRIKGIGAVRLNQIIKQCNRLNWSIIDFFNNIEEKQIHFSFLKQEMIQEIINFKKMIYRDEIHLNLLRKDDIIIKMISDIDYPYLLKETLGLSAPPLLYFLGNLQLMQPEYFKIAVVGTRTPSKMGKAITEEVGSLSFKGFTLISGNAKGVDKLGHNSALNSGGNTIYILGQGIMNYKYKNRNLGNDELIISEFHPFTSFHSGLLMARNKTIAAIADAVIVVESRYNGGAYNTGIHALTLGKSLYTFTCKLKEFEQSGNRELIKKGANNINLTVNNFKEKLQTLIEKIKQDNNKGNFNKDQLDLLF